MLGKETKVINIRDSKNAPDEVYIGRAGAGKDGYFGNPILLHSPCPECGVVHKTKGSTLPCYEKYLIRRVKEDEEFKKRVSELSGKTLVCFCKPNKCHGDILATVADNLAPTTVASEPLQHEVSVERLYHFKCASCSLWWTIGDFHKVNTDEITCPHCKTTTKTPDLGHFTLSTKED